MNRTLRKTFLRVASIIALLAALSMAQVTTVDIVGTVTDHTGAVVPGAKITVTHAATNLARSMEASTNGDYTFSLLPLGGYSVSVEADGFKRFETRMSLAAGERGRVDAQMQLGDVNEVVEVSAQAQVLQTDSATVNVSVPTRSVQDLPTNGRNFINLVQIGAGMNDADQGLSSGSSPDDRRLTSGFSANGQTAMANNYLLDGLDNNERAIGTIVVKPSIEALEEIQVQSSLYPASVGRAAGAVVNQVTKSGSNAFHGSLFEFIRNDKLDARDFFAVTRPKIRQNQFGGSLGGPIVKNKLFFFGDYEAFRKVGGSPAAAQVPTACQLGKEACNGVTQLGNFSDLLPLGKTVTAGFPGPPAPGNVIPLSQISPIGMNWAALYPVMPSSQCQGVVCLYRSNPTTVQFSHSADLRIDNHLSEKSSFFGRYSINNVDTNTQGNLPAVDVAGISGVEPGGGNGWPGKVYQRQQGLATSYTRIVNSNLVMQLAGQVARYVSDAQALNAGKYVSSAFGMKNYNEPSIPGADGLAGTFMLTGDVTNPGDAFALPTAYKDTTYQFMGTMNWTGGAHSIKAGGSWINRQWSVNQQLFKGILMFGGLSGTAFSDLIQGIPLGLMRQVTFSTPMYNNKEYALHIQDDWRATRWLTLNVGLRYDIFTPTTERHNRLSNFDPTDAAMLASGKIQMAGVNGISATNGIATQYNNFQPRLGFAATAGRGFVVRGGFGTTYYPDTQANPGYQKNAPLTSTYFGPTTMSQAPPIQPDSDCLVASCGNNTPGTAVAAAMVKNLKWPIVYMTNLMFEKSFGDNLITAGYVGQFTRNGPYVFSNANQPLPPLEKGGCGTVVDVRSLPDPCQPYYKSIPNVSVIQLLTDKGFSNYNAFQVEFRRNLQKGLMINTNYTLTNNLSNGGSQRSSCGGGCQNTLDDVSRDYGPDDIMVKHRYVMMASYMLPFGNNLKGIAGVLGKGWQMNGIYIYSSGLPFNVTDGLDTQNTAVGANQGTERMDVVPSSGFTQSINQWFDTSQFRRQTKGTFGNLGMNAFTGPASKKLDMSLFKEFRVKESVAAQFRAEIFNLTNTPSFGGPSFSIPGYSADGKPSFAGSTFGMITATNSMATPRQIQFAVKLVF